MSERFYIPLNACHYSVRIKILLSPSIRLERRVEDSSKVPEVHRLIQHQGLHLRTTPCGES